MTALSADRNTKFIDELGVVSLPVKATTQIYLGSLVCLDSTGYLIPAANTLGNIFAGVADENVLGGASNGDVYCRVRVRGVHTLVGASLAVTDVGAMLYVTDDQTVSKTAANVPVGRLAFYTAATEANIEISECALKPALDGDLFIIPFHWSSTVGTAAVKPIEDLEIPVPYKILAGYAKAQTAPGSGYQCDITISDGTTTFTVVIDDTATLGENETAGTVLMKAATDTDIALVDDNASASTADVDGYFVCQKIRA